MLISELAERTGTSTRALRHYEHRGLLRPDRRANGYRDYPPAAVQQVRRIRMLLDMGLNLDQAAELLPCFAVDDELTACDPALQRLRGQIADLDRRISALRSTRRMLHDTLDKVASKRTTAPDATPR